MHEYDSTLKLLLQESAERSLFALTGAPIARLVQPRSARTDNRRADLLGETPDGTLIHIELQGNNDGAMALRMAEYCLRIYRHLLKFPRQIVLYMGREPLRMPAELVGPGISFRYDLIDIRKLDGEALLASSQVGDNVIAILTRFERDKESVQAVLRRLSDLERRP
jgi:hypothetical protein